MDTNVGKQQLEIMKIIWELGEATVRGVYETLLKRRRVAYTTVMTMMSVLEEKGHLKKRQVGRAFVYRPARSRSQVVGGMVTDFVGRVFNGSAEALVVQLIKDKRLSPKDLDRIKELIEEAE